MARFGFDTHPKFVRLGRRLNHVATGMGDLLAWGALEFLWSAAYDRLDDLIGDTIDVEASCHWRGQDGYLCAALLECGFIEEREPGKYHVHDLWDHAPDSVKKRLQREMSRRAEGKSISEIRSEVGKEGRAKQLNREGNKPNQANGGQTADVCPVEAGKSTSKPGKSAPGKGGEGKGGEEEGISVANPASAAPLTLVSIDPPKADPVLTVLMALNEARKRVIPGARLIKPTAENRKHINDRLKSGNEVDELLYVVGLCEAEVRSGGDPKWFDAMTPFRPDNFAKRMAMRVEDIKPRQPSGQPAEAPRPSYLKPLARIGAP